MKRKAQALKTGRPKNTNKQLDFQKSIRKGKICCINASCQQINSILQKYEKYFKKKNSPKQISMDQLYQLKLNNLQKQEKIGLIETIEKIGKLWSFREIIDKEEIKQQYYWFDGKNDLGFIIYHLIEIYPEVKLEAEILVFLGLLLLRKQKLLIPQLLAQFSQKMPETIHFMRSAIQKIPLDLNQNSQNDNKEKITVSKRSKKIKKSEKQKVQKPPEQYQIMINMVNTVALNYHFVRKGRKNGYKCDCKQCSQKMHE